MGGSKRVEFKNSLALAFEDKYPVTQGHMLVSPLRHTPSFFLNWVLQNRTEGPAFFCCYRKQRRGEIICIQTCCSNGFQQNVEINDGGSDAGQMIMHSALDSSFDSKADWW